MRLSHCISPKCRKEVSNMSMEKRLCVICTWQKDCQKRFTDPHAGQLNLYCPDFTRNYLIKDVDADQKLLEAQLEKWRKEERVELKPCITVSREAGVGGSEICRKVAAELNMDLIGGQILSRIAESTHMSKITVQSLERKEVQTVERWITSFFTARHLSPDVYFQHLVKIIRTVGQHGNAVIIGRGAQYILPPNRTLRMRIIGPIEKRIDHIIGKQGCSRAEAQEYVAHRDHDRKAFIMKYFHEDIANSAHYDLVVNMAEITVDEAVSIIKQAFQARHFPAS